MIRQVINLIKAKSTLIIQFEVEKLDFLHLSTYLIDNENSIKNLVRECKAKKVKIEFIYKPKNNKT